MSCIELVCSTPSARSPKEKYSPDVSNFVLWPSATESADTCRPSMRSRQKCSASMRKPGICPGTPSIWGDRRWRSLSRHIDMDACDILCGIALLRLALLVGLLLRRLEIVPSRSIYCERTENLASITVPYHRFFTMFWVRPGRRREISSQLLPSSAWPFSEHLNSR